MSGFFGALAVAAQAPSLAWETGQGHRSAALKVPSGGRSGFTVLPPALTGLTVTNVLSLQRGATNQVLFNGSGVAAGDYDGDGLCDLYFCGLENPNVLYRNRGSWKFEPVPDAPTCSDQASTGAVFADVDGDGDLDLLVSSFGRGVRLFLNLGTGRFEEATDNAGLTSRAGSTSMALADIDGDGDLDIYVANYRVNTLQDNPNTVFRLATRTDPPRIVSVDGRPASDPELRDRYYVAPGTRRVMENGEADFLYLNDGTGRFELVDWTDGRFRDEAGQPISTPFDWGLAVMFRDINQDGAPDLYVCNDGDSVDRIWINDGHGKFQALSTRALRKTSFSSMGVDFADLNRDGWDEIVVTDMLSYDRRLRHTQMVDRRPPGPPGQWQDRPAYMQNTLFLNRGDGTYAEIAYLAGVEASDWSWSPVFLDVDLDGYEDLLVTTGLSLAFRDADARRQIDQARAGLTAETLGQIRSGLPPLATPHFAFKNRGDLTFELVSKQWGFDSTAVGHGLALADLDNDGDLDLVVNSMNAPALVCRNDSSAPRLAVRLRGRSPNSQGIGARIVVHSDGPVQSQEMICGGRYVSGDEHVRVFAALRTAERTTTEVAGEGHLTERTTTEPGDSPIRIEVAWRSGARSVIEKAHANRAYEIIEPEERPGLRAAPKNPTPWFEDRSALLTHEHQDAPFDDFALQPLLSRQLSRPGPGLAWFDLDGNGHEDLLVPGGRGGQMSFFLNDGRGAFERLDTGELTGTNRVDQGMVLGWATGAGAGFLVSLLNYEGGGTNVPPVLQYEIGAVGARQIMAFPGQESTAGPMALADVDNDGDLDLFLGGRVVPKRYPAAASSRLFLFDQGKWILDTNNAALGSELGLVSGALFTDLDGDGWPELVLACEWGLVRVFANRKGRFTETTAAWGLNGLSGWWNSVTAGDFNGDGLMDLVAGNWGRNTKYQRYLAQPLILYYADLNGDGIVEPIETHYDPALRKTVPWRFWDTMIAALPSILEQSDSFAAYSTATVQAVLGSHWPSMQQLETRTLDSMLFLNRGGRFEPRPLPLPAQVAPVFGLSVADFDGDGAEDLFLAQNFFGVDSETGRYDAGRGLILRGDGQGNFTAVDHSGIEIYGEQRGAAVCDYDGDGRADLAVAQNGAATKLYRNTQAQSGLRVRLLGPPNNPTAVGAMLRLRFDSILGPAREVRAGSGYWSQDSPVQVLATPQPPSGLWIKWPGGKEASAELPAGAREVVADFNGRFGVIK